MIANPLIPAFRYDPYTKRLTRELYEHEEMRRMRGQAVEQARESLKVTASKDGEGEGKQKEMWAVVLGTLGRQGNLRVLRVSAGASKDLHQVRVLIRRLDSQSVTRHLAPTATSTSTSTTTINSTASSTPFIPMLLSELSPAKLSLFQGISTFVQTSCPRLSIDWGYAFPKPLLSPYEASVALGVQGARGWSGMGRPAVLEGTKVEAGEARASEQDYPMDFYADKSLGEWTPRHGMGVRKAGGEKGRPVPKSKRAATLQAQAIPVA